MEERVLVKSWDTPGFTPVSPQVEVPGRDEPMAENEREATCGTSCKDLGGIVPPEAKLKKINMTLFHPGLPVWRTPATALNGGLGGTPPSVASSKPYGLSPRGQPEWDRRRAWWGYLERWLETVTWVLARSWLRQAPITRGDGHS